MFISANFNAYGSYVVDSLYQWDINRFLIVEGLNLSVMPELHFENANMDRAIVRQATDINNGNFAVKIPNSLLQTSLTIKVYIGVYEDDAFKVIEKIEIPVIARKRPYDYQIEDSDEEIYSFNALETLFREKTNALDEANAAVTEANTRFTEARDAMVTATQRYNDAAALFENAPGNEGILDAVAGKANKPTVTASALVAANWSNGEYSFEDTYPVATYDVEIALNSTATAAQAEAYNSAQIVGSATTNTVKAFGTVPTVDIPIILKVVAK